MRSNVTLPAKGRITIYVVNSKVLVKVVMMHVATKPEVKADTVAPAEVKPATATAPSATTGPTQNDESLIHFLTRVINTNTSLLSGNHEAAVSAVAGATMAACVKKQKEDDKNAQNPMTDGTEQKKEEKV